MEAIFRSNKRVEQNFTSIVDKFNVQDEDMHKSRMNGVLQRSSFPSASFKDIIPLYLRVIRNLIPQSTAYYFFIANGDSMRIIILYKIIFPPHTSFFLNTYFFKVIPRRKNFPDVSKTSLHFLERCNMDKISLIVLKLLKLNQRVFTNNVYTGGNKEECS